MNTDKKAPKDKKENEKQEPAESSVPCADETNPC